MSKVRSTMIFYIQWKYQKSAFEIFCSWSESTYTRNCIFENERFELILICWQSSQKTPIHDHGGEECWVKFIDGEFKETIYKSNEVSEDQYTEIDPL